MKKTTAPSMFSVRRSAFGISAFLLSLSALPSYSAQLIASDGALSDYFGRSVSLSGGTGLVGANLDDDNDTDSGSAYLFRNLDTATGTITQNAKLIASDGLANDLFGSSVSMSGSTGLAGAPFNDYNNVINPGAAYLFRNLDTATGTVTQNAKLTASDGAANDYLGTSLSLSSSTGLVGAAYDDDKGTDSGSAYLFRNLDTATGTVTQNAKLTASDGAANDFFGSSASLSGSIGLVGAYGDADNGAYSGSAYIFRNLDTATGAITQNAKLIASDGAADDYFGTTVSLSGSTALVGAYVNDHNLTNSGAAYVFRNLDTATGTVTQNAKLIASDAAVNDRFGNSVSLSGSTGLVGAYYDDDKGNASGSAYLFRNLDTATGTVTENVKLTASDGAENDLFGSSVSLDGDTFLIGAYAKNDIRGKAYSGSVSSVTTLDQGSTSRTIDGISFVSKDDWIIGQSANANTVHLTTGDAANVTAPGKAVFIGKNAGSNANTLILSGTFAANEVHIGSILGNAGNTLQIDSTATFGLVTFRLADGNFLSIQGDYTDTAALLGYLGSATLQVWDQQLSQWNTVTSGNAANLITSDFSGGYTTIQTIPEPTTTLLATLGAGTLLLRRIRKRTPSPTKNAE